LLPKSSDPKSNDTCKCPDDHSGHFPVTPESPCFTPGRKSLIGLPISTIRTSDLDVRSQVLYPAELRAQARSLASAGISGNLIQCSNGCKPARGSFIHYTNWLTFIEI